MPVPARPRVGLRQAWWVLLIFACQKAVFLGWAWADDTHPLLVDLYQWDAPRYLDIAQHGYTYPTYASDGREINSNIAFFALYPLLGRFLAAAVPPLGEAGALLVVAGLASLAGAWGLYALGTKIASPTAGAALALGWGMLPRAFIEVMPYSEGLFTALSVWAILALATRRYWVAAALCALAGLTRPTAAATLTAVGGYLLVLLVASFVPRWRDRVRTGRATIIGAGLLSATGLGLSFAHVAWRTGSWRGYFDVQDQWNLRLGPPSTTWQLWRTAITTSQPPGYETNTAVAWALPVLTALLVALVVVAMRRPRWWPTAVHALVIWAMMATTQTYFHSRERYLLPAFGLVVPVALVVARLWDARAARPLTRALLVLVLVAGTLVSAWWGVELVTTSKISP
ncbi:hypothetical protein ACQB6R_13865 [Propionibacteriaceae bacterium G1746]|uniref:hypothetical protein n=1 Tax=Aestuariimicrobium sp. G57 TaxID=3418485 RepID=UPI003C20E6BC